MQTQIPFGNDKEKGKGRARADTGVLPLRVMMKP
jgi:hypothetical protein